MPLVTSRQAANGPAGTDLDRGQREGLPLDQEDGPGPLGAGGDVTQAARRGTDPQHDRSGDIAERDLDDPLRRRRGPSPSGIGPTPWTTRSAVRAAMPVTRASIVPGS